MLIWAIECRSTGKIINLIPFKVKRSEKFHMKMQGDEGKKEKMSF